MRSFLFSTLIATGLLTLSLPASANELDVPIIEHGEYNDDSGGEILPTCTSSTVTGLSKDGFLAVRAGPGSQYRKLAELHNGDVVYEFDHKGKWRGVVYGTPSVKCLTTKTRPVTYPNKGWVHSKWLEDLAG